MIVEDAHKFIEEELHSNEKILWVGQPNKRFDFKYIIYQFLCFFAVLLFAKSGLKIAAPIHDLVEGFPYFLPVLFIAIVIGSIRYWYLGREFYSVTTKALLIISRIPKTYVHRIPFDDITSSRLKNSKVSVIIKGTSSLKSRTAMASFTAGFYNRVIVHLKYLSDPKTPYELLQQNLKRNTP